MPLPNMSMSARCCPVVAVASRQGDNPQQRRVPSQLKATAAPLRERSSAQPGAEEASTSAQQRELLEAAAAAPSAAKAAPAGASASTSGRIVLESPEELRSTWQHRAWVASGTSLMAATLGVGLAHIQGPGDAVAAGAALLSAYLLADLGTAVYHWLVDNYGSAATPVFGGQIAAFQGHHQRPWTITERQFCNNMHKVCVCGGGGGGGRCWAPPPPPPTNPAPPPPPSLRSDCLPPPSLQLFMPATPFAAVLLASAAAGAPAWWDVWSSSFLFLACMSQQFHAWSHMKASQLPSVVVAAQDAGLLISRRAHGAHHRSPFNCNYAIVSGVWNAALDGDLGGELAWGGGGGRGGLVCVCVCVRVGG